MIGLSLSALRFSFIPNRALQDGAETPKPRTRSFIQALLKENDLEKVGEGMFVLKTFGLPCRLLIVVVVCASVPDVFGAPL